MTKEELARVYVLSVDVKFNYSYNEMTAAYLAGYNQKMGDCMKQITMDFETYERELRSDYIKGYDTAIMELVKYISNHKKTDAIESIVEYLEKEEDSDLLQKVDRFIGRK